MQNLEIAKHWFYYLLLCVLIITSAFRTTKLFSWHLPRSCIGGALIAILELARSLV